MPDYDETRYTYKGALIFTQPLTQEHKDFITEWKKLYNIFRITTDGVYIAIDYMSYEPIYKLIKELVIGLKKLGNDFTTDSYLVSCSEYGLNHEAVVLSYKTGEFVEKPVLDLIDEYLSK